MIHIFVSHTEVFPCKKEMRVKIRPWEKELHEKCGECPNRATFGTSEVPFQFCRIHMKPGMISSLPHCLQCKSSASYGLQREPTHCYFHATDEMHNCNSPACEQCTVEQTIPKKIRTAGWGWKDEAPRFCRLHAQPEMINLYETCVERHCREKCVKNSLYCEPHGGFAFCFRCSTRLTVHTPDKLCQSCQQHPGKMYCVHCRKVYLPNQSAVEMVQLVNDPPFCTVCLEARRKLPPKDLGMCRCCRQLLQPEEWVYCAICEIRPERTLRYWLQKNWNKHLRSTDKRVGPSRLRPDFVLQMPKGWVVVECDEREHEFYKGEEERMHILQDELGGPCVFLRWNPAQRSFDPLQERLQFWSTATEFPQNLIVEYLGYKKRKHTTDV